MPRGLQVGSRRAFSQHLKDGIARHQVDQKKHQGDYQPDHGQGVDDTHG